MYDKIRYSLADRSGVLRVEWFDIEDCPEHEALAGQLREYLMGRALRDVHPAAMETTLQHAPAECRTAVMDAVREMRELAGYPTR